MINQQTILAIIPARGGSKGLPGKNIKMIGGKPMLAWTIEAAKGSRYIDRIILSSDDNDIINTAKQYHCEVPFVRPAALAQDRSTAVETVIHAIDQLPAYDIIVLLQPTCPLRDHEDIDRAIEKMISTGANSCVSVSEVDKSPYWMYTTSADSRLKPLIKSSYTSKQRQELPTVHVLNGAIYIINTSVFKIKGDFVTDDTVAYIMNKDHSIDIDYEIDLKIAEYIISQQHIAK